MQSRASLCGRFRFPLSILVVSAGGELTRLRGEVTGPDTSFHFTLPRKPARIEIDPDNILCGRIEVEQSDDQILAALREGSSVPVRLRAIAVLSHRAGSDTRLLRALAECARGDRHRAVRKAAAGVCADIDISANPDAGALLKTLFLEIRRDVHSGVRAVAFNGLRKFRDASLREVFLEGMRDSSYYVEAAAMNCLLDADGHDGWGIIKPRLHARSHGDILALAALDWVAAYPSAEAYETVLRLAGPGHSFALRGKAFEALLRLRPSAAEVRGVLQRQLGEPRYQIRMFAVSALGVLGHETAENMAKQHLEHETDPRVRDRISTLLSVGWR